MFRYSSRWLASVTLLVACFLAPRTRADDLADAKESLGKQGIRVFTGGVALASEGAVSKELGKAPGLKRALTQTVKEQQAAEQAQARAEQAATALRQQQVALSAQLAGINPNNVGLNNKLVGALQATEGQLELVRKEIDRLEGQVRTSRGKANEAREAYIQFVLDTRKLADSIGQEYETKAALPEVQAALATVNKAVQKNFTLGPSPALQATLRKLQTLEETVLSEAIPLLGEGQEVARVSVVINGKHQQEMVVDSGASLICLPQEMAAKFGLKPSDKDQKIVLQLADGSEIEGHKMTIPSVRVGKFTVNNVDCAVLGPAAVNAEPLLGMSFLGNFKFELDASARTLTMVKIAGADPAAGKSRHASGDFPPYAGAGSELG